MKKALLILGVLSVTTSAYASRQSIVTDYWCAKGDTYFNPFKLAATRSCAKDHAISDAEERCSAIGGYIANTEADVSCEFVKEDNYRCDATANVTCEL